MRITGTLGKIVLPRGFGFIRGDDGVSYFLLADELTGTSWSGETVREGMRAEFEVGATERGPRARDVRLS